MDGTVMQTNAVKMYLFSRNMKEEDIRKRTGLNFDPQGFYYGEEEFTPEQLRRIRTGCHIVHETNGLNTVADLSNAGLFETEQDRIYFGMIQSGKTADEIGRSIGMSGAAFKHIIGGSRTASRKQKKAMAPLMGVSLEFIESGDLSFLEEEPAGEADDRADDDDDEPSAYEKEMPSLNKKQYEQLNDEEGKLNIEKENNADEAENATDIINRIWTWSEQDWEDLLQVLDSYMQFRAKLTGKQEAIVGDVRNWTNPQIRDLEENIREMEKDKTGR